MRKSRSTPWRRDSNETASGNPGAVQQENMAMSEKVKRYAFLTAGLMVILFANFYIGETPLGWATLFAGLGIYYYGWRGVCPACQAGRCGVELPKNVDERR
jgi:hypothetical protein